MIPTDSRTISEKEEIARAALRSLAEDASAPPLPRPLPPTTLHLERPAPAHTAITHAAAVPPMPPRSHSTTDVRSLTSGNSFFDHQPLSTSPESSPRLATSSATQHAYDMPPIDPHIQQSIIHKVSLLLRVSTDDIERILQQACSRRASTLPNVPISPDLIQHVLHAYQREAQVYQDRATALRHDLSHHPLHEPHAYTFGPGPSSRPLHETDASHNVVPREIPSESVVTPSSPSPFAFDPYRRPSQPASRVMQSPENVQGYARVSLDSGNPRIMHRSPAGHTPTMALAYDRAHQPLYNRKGRSTDDYLQQSHATHIPVPPMDYARTLGGSESDRFYSPRYEQYPSYGRHSLESAHPHTFGISEPTRSRYASYPNTVPQSPAFSSKSFLTHSPSPVPDPQYRRTGIDRGSDEFIDGTRVAGLRVEDRNSPTPSVGKARSVGSTSSLSSNPAVSDISHSEIMQRLKEKVKSRLAAKDKAGLFKSGKQTGVVDGVKGARAENASVKTSRTGTPSKRATPRTSVANTPKLQAADASEALAEFSIKARKLSKATTSVHSPSPQSARTGAPNSIAAALHATTDSPTPTEAARKVAAAQASNLSRGPDTVETAAGQALPVDLPGAGQMNASSASKQQSSMAGIDSLLQAAAASDPTETSSAIA